MSKLSQATMPEDDFIAEYVVLLEFFETLLIFTVRQIETPMCSGVHRTLREIRTLGRRAQMRRMAVPSRPSVSG